jgi:hypothetical protein
MYTGEEPVAMAAVVAAKVVAVVVAAAKVVVVVTDGIGDVVKDGGGFGMAVLMMALVMAYEAGNGGDSAIFHVSYCI